ncbi:MAG: DUF2149 domain-containing protein [Planctomycetes bacterium]|nr:DUF2149 domain-containing protein [Planctomycetota bacterium]
MSRLRLHDQGEDDDPLAGVANFFDLGIVFALGFMLAITTWVGLPELLDRRDVTLVKNAGSPQMEIIHKQGRKVERYKVTRQNLGGEGERLGIAYRLENGQVVFVPEAGESDH